MNSNLRSIIIASFAALLFTTLRLSASAGNSFIGSSSSVAPTPRLAASADSTEAAATQLTTDLTSITWGPAANMVGDTDVSNAGNYVDAITFYSSSLTVGGVLFHPLGAKGNPRTDGTISVSYQDNVGDYTVAFCTGTPSSVTYSNLVNTSAYGESSGTVTLSKLTVGHVYQVQSWSYSNGDAPGTTTYSGTTPVTLDNLTGQFSIGTFTANATSVSYRYSTTQGYHNFINTVSLRDITDGSAPVTPINLQSPVGNNLAFLSWSSAPGATSYNIYRSTTPGGEGSTPFATGVGSLFYADLQANNGTTYYYTVAAVNIFGTSPQSSEVTAKPGSAAAMQIAWGHAKNMVGNTDVSTTGTCFDAISFYEWPATVNGVVFNPMSPTGKLHSDGKIVITNGDRVGAYGVPFTMDSPSSPGYYAITDAGAFGEATDTIILMNLSVGDIYQVQSWSYDSNDGTATTTYSGSTPVTLVNGTGQYSTGTFTATSTSEYYNYSTGGGHDIVNAISVRAIAFMITASGLPVAGGTTNGGGTYNSGSTATVTATPASGYLFADWTEDGSVVSTSANYSFTVLADHTLVANFIPANEVPTVTTGSATGITAVSGTLSGTANPNEHATTLYFQYGTSTSYGNTTAAQNAGAGIFSKAFNVAIADLSATTTYHYQIVASNTNGVSYGDDQVFTTATATLAASTGAAKAVSSSSATLNGTINPDGAAASVCFEYGTTKSYGLTTGTESLAGGAIPVSVSLPATSLQADTLYHYRCVATNSLGTVLGSDRTFYTAHLPPTAATAEEVTKMHLNGITVSGTVNPNGLPTTCYFQYGLSGSAATHTAKVAVGNGKKEKAVSASISHLEPNQTYFYCLVATSGVGTVTGGTLTFVTGAGAPSAPSVTISGTGETVAAVDASLDTQDGETNVWFQYGLTKTYGKTTEIAALEPNDLASTASVDLFALAPHTTYLIRCAAQNAEGTTYSSGTTFTTLPRFDMIGNGCSDLLLSDTATGETTLLSVGSVTASGTALTVTGSMAGPVISATANLTFRGEAEFNQNGTIAWVLSGSTPAETEFLISGSDGWTPTPLITGTFKAPTGATVAGVADFNGDGNPDLVLVGANRKITFWMLEGFTVTAQKAGPTLPMGFVVAALDDLNGNGTPDILIWNPENGKTETLAMNRTALSSTTAGPTVPTGWQLMGANVYTAATPQWLLYNPDQQTIQVWTVKGHKVESADEGSIPTGLNPQGTK